jgi:acetyl esterase/lipase
LKNTFFQHIFAAVCVVIGLSSGGGSAEACSINEEYGVSTTFGVVYGKGLVAGTPANLLLDVWTPTPDWSADKPAVIVVHGWGANRTDMGNFWGSVLGRRGFVCFAIDYRWATEMAMADLRTAIRHVRANAGAYGVDPDKIGVLGYSLGGSYVLSVAGDEADFPSDLPGDPVNNAGVSSQVACIVDQAGGSWYAHEYDSPDDPPLCVLHGIEDDVVSINNAYAILDQIQQVGVPYAFYAVPGADHGDTWMRVVQPNVLGYHAVLHFLSNYLGCGSENTLRTLHAFPQGPGHIVLTPPYGMYHPGDQVQMTAVPDTGTEFLYWTGAAVSDPTASTTNLTISDHTRVDAVLAAPGDIRPLALDIVGDASVVMDPPGGRYPAGTVVTLRATGGIGSVGAARADLERRHYGQRRSGSGNDGRGEDRNLARGHTGHVRTACGPPRRGIGGPAPGSPWGRGSSGGKTPGARIAAPMQVLVRAGGK